MNKKIVIYTVMGIVFVSILGCLSHFSYAWFGKNRWIALICPVNESTWEHMKLLFFPMLFYTFCMTKKLEEYPSVLLAALTGNILGTLLMPVLFYTYTGVLGYHITVIDVSVFFVSVIFAFVIAYRLADRKNSRWCQGTAIGVTVLLCVLFFVFTFYPPDIALFADPTLNHSGASFIRPFQTPV